MRLALWILSRIWGCNCRRGIDWILDLLTPLITTSNYIATANRHISQFTTAHAKPFQACCFFTCRSLTTASVSGYSSAFRAQVLPSSSIVQSCPSAIPSNGVGPSLYSLGVSQQKTPFPIIPLWLLAYVTAGTSVPSRCLAMDVSSGSTIPNFRRHVTICFVYFLSSYICK
jgi:hypothetical protein